MSEGFRLEFGRGGEVFWECRKLMSFKVATVNCLVKPTGSLESEI
jgi:hypothetical protein